LILTFKLLSRICFYLNIDNVWSLSINNRIQGSTKCKFFHQSQKAKYTELTQNRKFKHSIFLTSGNVW